MDSLITAAARALSLGDPLGALNRVALRDDAPALALRGIALAQLGDLERARQLVRKAAAAFGAKAPLPRARCILAEAEIAFVSRDLGWPAQRLEAARAVLEARGDRANAAHAVHLEARRRILFGDLAAAEQMLATVDAAALPPALRAAHELARAELAVRRLETAAAAAALTRASEAARNAGIHGLIAEVERAAAVLQAPAARLIARGHASPLTLAEVAALKKTPALIVDACRFALRDPRGEIALARRPVLFALAQALAEAWPGDVSRDALVARAFGAKRADESHRARLRVEIGRLRAAAKGLAEIRATRDGFALAPRRAREVLVLARPVDEKHGAVLAFLSDGEAWSSSALALALGTGQRNVQRALDDLARAGTVQSFGRGRARRWTMPPLPGFTTTLLLPAPLAAG
jgi:hypothetical protein